LLFCILHLTIKYIAVPTIAPTATTGNATVPSPAAPIDYKTATVVPAATLPPEATAAEDIMPAAVLPAAIPPDVNPRPEIVAIVPPTAVAAPVTPDAIAPRKLFINEN